MTSSRPGKRFDWSNLGLRAASATVLIPAVLAAIWFGGGYFLAMMALAVVLLSYEWGRMSARRAPRRVTITVGVVVMTAVLLTQSHHFGVAWLVAFVGAALAAAIVRGIGERPSDAAFGVLYIGGPCLALIWLRTEPDQISWTILLFAVTWSADIAAFAVGSVLKGPKLSPRLSPNKTWTGFVGGLVAAMLAAMGMALAPPSTVRLGLVAAALIGLAGGLATMGGDLWESMLKRRFGVKDSGDIIPGHGGLLDRVDGLMFAVLAVAGARLIYQTGWTH